MPVNHQNLRRAARLLGPDHARALRRLAQRQDEIESKWAYQVGELHDEIREMLVDQLKDGKRIHLPDYLFEELMFLNYMETVDSAHESVERELDVISKEKRLARPPRPKIPKTLAEIRRLYDHFQKTGQVPKRISDLAQKVKKEYLQKTQQVWRRYSAEFREGDVANQERVIQKIKKAADTVPARAKTIVRTETTNYYNETRREIYDQSDDIWGYLFLAIRDQGTTKWCSDKITHGKRGRHGLVYRKGDPLTTKETPSCHWNCRSEMVPLTPFNPRHRKLIEDESLHRRSHSCHPLPEGWR